MYFGHALQPALQIKAQQHKRRYKDHKQVGHVQPGVGDHLRKAEIRILPGQELDKIVQDPSRDHRVERHDGNVADEADDAEYAHLWPGFSRRWYMVTGLAWAARPTANSMTMTGRPSTSRQRM